MLGVILEFSLPQLVIPVSDSQLLSDFKADKRLSTCTQSVLEFLKNGKMKVG